MSTKLRFPVVNLSSEAQNLRLDVRKFLDEERVRGTLTPSLKGSARWSPQFSRAVGARGWIGMTWPRIYGGRERPTLERYIVSEEMLAAGAPTLAHWVADRQSGPNILRFGSETQKQKYLPQIARGECYFCIGMSEPDSGSDLASIRTRARKVEDGWEIEGTKIWTSNAPFCHMMILLARTAPRGEDRHSGMSQFLVDLAAPGISIRPIENLAGDRDFNEVVFDRVRLGEDMLIGEIGSGWSQVTSELAYERSGPERWLSTYTLLVRLIDALKPAGPKEEEALGRLIAHLATLQRMSMSVAGMLQEGVAPAAEAAMVKDLGTTFEQEVPAIARLLVPLAERTPELAAELNRAILWSPAFSIRGGTREVLRGITARALGLR